VRKLFKKLFQSGFVKFTKTAWKYETYFQVTKNQLFLDFLNISIAMFEHSNDKKMLENLLWDNNYYHQIIQLIIESKFFALPNFFLESSTGKFSPDPAEIIPTDIFGLIFQDLRHF